MDLKDVLQVDHRISQWLLRNKDVYEGIRAMLVDQNSAPVWTPGSLDEVTEEMVGTYVQPLAPEKELVFYD